MSLLRQIRTALPSPRDRIVYLKADLVDAERIAGRVRELHLPAVKYVIALDWLEERPKDGDPRQASYDLLISALREVEETLNSMPELETVAV